MNEILYVIDSSVIIRRTKHDMYEYDSFPIHWDNFDRMINEGKIIAPIIVKDEIVNKKHDELKIWSDNFLNLFRSMNNNISTELGFLEEKFPEWYHNYDDSKDNWADPYLIAYAMAYSAVLVTQEKCNLEATNESNYKIPTICAKLGAYCHSDKLVSKSVNPDTAPF